MSNPRDMDWSDFVHSDHLTSLCNNDVDTTDDDDDDDLDGIVLDSNGNLFVWQFERIENERQN